MRRIGLYGGTFNPPTKAHIEMAKKALKECKLDRIIFIPVGDLYPKDGMAKGIHRYKMLQLACKEEENLQVSDIEIKSNKNYKAIDIFEILKNKYKGDETFFLMGTDNLKKLPFWEKGDKLVSNFNYIILDRGVIDTNNIIETNDLLNKNKERFTIVKNQELKECSATEIREQIKKGEKPKNLDNKVYNYIIQNKIY